jgi:hypothetical protein
MRDAERQPKGVASVGESAVEKAVWVELDWPWRSCSRSVVEVHIANDHATSASCRHSAFYFQRAQRFEKKEEERPVGLMAGDGAVEHLAYLAMS